MENFDAKPLTIHELLAERDRIVDALRFKDEQTAANVAAGVVTEGDRDEDREALLEELLLIEHAMSEANKEAQDARMDAVRQVPIEGME